MKLSRRKILVTGAASGIGLEVVRLFESEGARLAIAARTQAEADAALRTMAAPDLHIAVSANLCCAAEVDAMIERAADALGGLDGLVNSAGVDHIAPFAETSEEAWRHVIDSNLTAAFLVCQAGARKLQDAGGGTIVTLSSGAGLLPLRGRSAYCAAKAGLIMFSKALALELADDNIRVNALCPGAIDTPMLRESAGGNYGDPVPAEIVSRFALGRIGLPDEIARAALFLTSEDSSFVTGTALAADGGRTFH